MSILKQGMRPDMGRGGVAWLARTLSVFVVLAIAGACGGAVDDEESSVEAVKQLARIVDPATPIATVGWVLKGTSVISGTAINLTPATGSKAGTAFYPSAVDPTTLTVSFHSSITGAANNADGIAFVMADATRLAANAVTTGLLGATGGGLGFSGIPGLAVVLDTYKNATDPSSNHVGVTDGATTPSVPDQLRLLATNQVPSLQGGHDFTVTVHPGQIAVTMDGTSVLTATVTLPSSVYFGFSAGTGGNPPAAQSVSNITVDGTLGTGVPVLTPTAILPGSAPTFVDRTAFLYTGTGKVQTGVVAGTIKADRAAVLRGHIVGDDKTTPATGTVVTVVGHPEYGQTVARADGWFDLAVNGGGALTIDYERAGHLPVQRTLMTQYNGTTVAPEVVLTVPYAHPTDRFTAGSAVWQTVRGTPTAAGVDADGKRQAVAMFPPNTHITNFPDADGDPNIVQITEFTRDRGKDRMPGDLPPSSAYTYAVDISIPAAAAAGVANPVFNQNIVTYVTNFTGYPTGEPVPLGTYDRAKGAWVGEASGIIVKLVSRTGGLADLDVNAAAGADPTLYAGLGITDGERQQLGALSAEYPDGTSLWRVSMPHLSKFDANWAITAPSGAKSPGGVDPIVKSPNCQTEQKGSIIGCEGQTLGEEVPVVGAPFSLRYQSERTPGYAAVVDFNIGPSSSATAPTAPVVATHIVVHAAGREFLIDRTGVPAVGERYHWSFDGLDAYGRKLRGSVPVEVRVGYEFGAVPTNSTKVFGSLDGLTITGNRAARTITFWSSASTTARLSVEDARFEEALGGWMLTNHHHFDPTVGASLGDGRVLRGEANQFSISTYAGGGDGTQPRTDGMSAKDLYIASLWRMKFAANGDLYIFYNQKGPSQNWCFDVIHPDGTVTPITGVPPLDTPNASLVDGAVALHASLYNETYFDIADDGTIYFVVPATGELWKITNETTRHLKRMSKAGPAPSGGCSSIPGPCADDGGPVEQAAFRDSRGVLVDPDGSIIVADSGHYRMRRVDPRGIVSTLEISGTLYHELFKGPNGERFGVDNGANIWEVGAVGKRTLRSGTAAQYGGYYSSWCDWPSNSAGLDPVIAWNGGFLADCRNLSTSVHMVRFVNDAGVATTVAGSPVAPADLGDGGPATHANLAPGNNAIISLAARGPSEFFLGAAYGATGTSARIRRVSATAPSSSGDGYYAPDGDVIYDFDATGRHRSTKSALRGTTLYSFGYDTTTGYLTSVTDRDGLVTTIARSGSNVTITAPFGQQTKLALDANGYATSITAPNTAEVTRMSHSANGLMTDFWDAKSNHHTFAYDTNGRLTRDTNAVASSLGTRLSATAGAGGQFAVTVTSPEGRAVVHNVDPTASSTDRARLEQRVITAPGMATTTSVHRADGSWSSSRAAGSTFLSSSQVNANANDPRWGALAPFVTSATESDGARTLTRTESRTATIATAFDPYSVTAMTITNSVAASGLPTRTWTRGFQYGSPSSTWLTTSPEGRQTRTTIDDKERVTAVEILGTDPVALASVQYHYDTSGRVDQITNGTRVFGTTYNAAGWVSGTTAPESMNTSITSRDANGRALTVVLPGSRTVGTTYDLAGNIASVTPPGKTAHAFTSNESNLLSLYAPPTIPQTPKDTGYVYDKDGLLTSVSNPGLPVSFAYDATNGRPTSMTDAVTVLFGYDPAGRRNTLTTSDNVATTLTYDGTLVTSESTTGAWPVTHALNRTFSHYGELASWSLDSGTADVVTHDKDGLLTGNGPIVVGRGTNGLVKTITVGSTVETYGYNVNGELMSATASGVTGGYSVTYLRDTLGRITKKTETIGGTTVVTGYGYDTAGRLWKVYANGSTTPTSTYTYDANGNRAGGTYDGQDRLTALGSATYTYGPNGELKTKTDGTLTTTYTYDAHGNLRRVVPPSPGATIDYVIDGQNRRVGKLLGGNPVNGWLYDGPHVEAHPVRWTV